MALSKHETSLLEAVAGYLRERAVLGLPKAPEETSHTSQFRWESLKDAFALKVAESAFYESVTSAFHAVHSYKYIDHPTFKLALSAELKSRAVPTEEINKALKAVDALVEGLSAKNPSERDAGWNPQIDEIADMTRNADTRTPKREAPFTGGGPWAEGVQKDYINLMIIEGVIPENDERAAKIAGYYSALQNKPWLMARPNMMKLAEAARGGRYANLAMRIERFIDESDSRSLDKVL